MRLSTLLNTSHIRHPQKVPTLSPLLIAIILGATIANLWRIPSPTQHIIDVVGKYTLRAGIVLLGLQLHLADLVTAGPRVITTAVLVVTTGILSTLAIGRLLGIHRDLTLLIACGFSICGAVAVAAATATLTSQRGGDASERARDTDERRGDTDERRPDASHPGGDTGDSLPQHSALAIALVVLFGTLMIPLIPLLGHALGLTATQTALWAGASVHEIAQVVAIGDAVDLGSGDALHLAVVMKLARVLLLAVVLAVITMRHRRPVAAPTGGALIRATAGSASSSTVTGSASTAASLGGAPLANDQSRTPRHTRVQPLIPTFVIGFIVMAALRTTGLLPDTVLTMAGHTQTVLLTIAMGALGTGVRIDKLMTVGGKPVLLAALATLIVGVVGLAGALTL